MGAAEQEQAFVDAQVWGQFGIVFWRLPLSLKNKCF